MEPYPDALNAMRELLSALGLQGWREWIEQDLNNWDHAKDVQHHLSAYGGMGSFTDTWVTDIWPGPLFLDLKAACYYFAHSPTEKPDVAALKSSMGTYWIELRSRRCLRCGYCATSPKEIDSFIARRIARKGIIRAAEHTQLQEFVHSVLDSQPQDELYSFNNVVEWLDRSGINRRNENDFTDLCPQCRTDDVITYGWTLMDQGEFRFEASDTNWPR